MLKLEGVVDFIFGIDLSFSFTNAKKLKASSFLITIMKEKSIRLTFCRKDLMVSATPFST